MNTAMEDSSVTIVNEARAANRASMPIVASFVDELRAAGLQPKVIFARENGITVGKRPANENAFTIPRGYLAPPKKKGKKA